MRILECAMEAIRIRRRAALCTVIGQSGSAPRHNAAKMLVYSDGSFVGTIGGGAFEKQLLLEASLAIQNGENRRVSVNLSRDLGMCCGGTMEVFVECLPVQKRVHLFGAGHVGQAVCKVLSGLEFDVWVYDSRDEWLSPCAPHAGQLLSGDPLSHLPAVTLDDYVLIFTHSHDLDQRLMEALIGENFGYLGMIGSKTKVAKFFLRMKASGVDPQLFENVSAPVGLDIGAETPQEIAVSIAAELIQVRAGRSKSSQPLSDQALPARRARAVASDG